MSAERRDIGIEVPVSVDEKSNGTADWEYRFV